MKKIQVHFGGVSEIVGSSDIGLLTLLNEDETRELVVTCDKQMMYQFALRTQPVSGVDRLLPEVLWGVIHNQSEITFEIDINDDITIKTIQFEHSNSSVLFSLSEESDGTRRLLDLIEVLLSENSNKIYVIDEIDRCLHPQLTYKLIESYLKLSKKSQRQLIVTTHESTLLDFELLRRGEIWFVRFTLLKHIMKDLIKKLIKLILMEGMVAFPFLILFFRLVRSSL